MHKNMHYKKIIIDIFAVTFRKEGVDWNIGTVRLSSKELASPSVRKVWIEIRIKKWIDWKVLVTFRKEGVDWNTRATNI